MIICEKEFDNPDPQDKTISLHEVDYYAWLPAKSEIANHRLSLRKNLKTGQFEIYRRFYLQAGGHRLGEAPESPPPRPKEEIIFAGSFTDAIAFGNKECVDQHGGEREPDIACPHLPTKHGFWCPDFRDYKKL